MIEVDGSQRSGSGTILRLSVALSAIRGEPLHICNVRQNRPKPGLKPQHLEAVLTAAKLCGAKVEGARLDSRELWFEPSKVKGGRIEVEIGTAGSIPMLLLAVMPICLFAEDAVSLHVSKGGTDVSHSPTVKYVQHVLLPVLRSTGVEAALTIRKYGYYPKGNGELTLEIKPCKLLKPLSLENPGNIEAIEGISVCTFLAERRVAERQAETAKGYLKRKGLSADITIVNDTSNPLQKGSSLTLWAKTDTGAVLGADAIGELKKTSEAVGIEAAEKLSAEISAKPTVDVHLADMLIPYAALAQGKSVFLVRDLSEHLQTNIWLAEKILGVDFDVSTAGKLHRVERIS